MRIASPTSRPRDSTLPAVHDAFVTGFVYGLLTGNDPQWAVNCGAAHGALAMTTPGDTSMATLPEVLQLMKGDSARIQR